jgi:DNA polymerase III subunit epsilon
MTRFEKETFVCLDCEMTGLDATQDRIIEIGIAKFNFDGVIAEYETLIDPERPISPSSIAIHHITEEMVQGKPKIQEVLPAILELIGSHILVGHGILHDIDMIAKACERNQIPTRIRQNATLDTLRMARLYGDTPVNSLEQLRLHFNVEHEGTHRAMGDAIVNMHVFKHLCRNYKSLYELNDALSRPIQMKIMPLGQHKGRPIKEIPIEYLLWAARKDFDQDLLFSLRSEINRRKKGNLFTQSASPFNDLEKFR